MHTNSVSVRYLTFKNRIKNDPVNLRPVVRGGRKADVRILLHNLMDQTEVSDIKWEVCETVRDTYPNIFHQTHSMLLNFSLWPGARYENREPENDEFEQFQQLVTKLETYLRSHQ